ncbi:hypothetical protein WAI453_010287 [Rhynchosporium graminicola]|uniref:Coiled-coil domain-containing protein 16 n=1 Tax=Rhynchosporium graminicola TaxID=2792576 RepID=A0A1E1KG69_9HELO|nr:uncharacterized protein RCO7_02714 [Rhynchosporium commune]
MADVRSLLKSERAARRIQHQYASYHTGGLSCTACHVQMKDALWDGHLRSAGHMVRVEKEVASKKRKASSESDGDGEGSGTIRKRSKANGTVNGGGIPEGFFDARIGGETIEIPSRPATPSKPILKPDVPRVDEDEWAAFEADIEKAEEEVKQANDAVISAPAMMASDIVKREESSALDLEGEKEDAARKIEEELEEMESLEQRVKKLREKREELRKRAVVNVVASPPVEEEEDEDDDDDDDDDDDGF